APRRRRAGRAAGPRGAGPHGGAARPPLPRPARRPHAREPDLQGSPRRGRAPQPRGLHGARGDRAGAALDRPPVRRAQGRPVLRLRDVRLRRPDRDRCGLLRPCRAAARGVLPVAAHRRAVPRAPRGDRGPARHGGRPQDRVARAARDRERRPGQLARAHQGDHGHLHGGPDPPLQARHGGLPGPGGAGVADRRAPAWRARRAPRFRRRHPPLPGALPRPVLQQPPGRGGDVRGRPGGRRRGRRRVAGPRAGRGGPMTIDAGPATNGTPAGAPRQRPGYDAETAARLAADAAQIVARYPHPRSALLPMLHLVQSEDGYVSRDGILFCAEQLGLTAAEVSAVATFYTQYKRHPNGTYTVGVCTNTLCAIMGGDAIFDELSEHLGVGHDETTEDGAITLERVECNAACDYAPVMMVNWEFFDNQTPASATDVVDRLRAGEPVAPTRGAASVCTFKQMSRVLAGFTDGRADEGVGAGEPTLAGLRLAREHGWTAPAGETAAEAGDAPSAADAASTGGTEGAPEKPVTGAEQSSAD